MGFCWQGRKLCCDVCGSAGARKVKCPFGYCQAIAGCPECRKSPEKKAKVFSKEAHRARGCERRHAEHVAREELEAKLRREGKFLRVSAMNRGEGVVQVIFRGADSEQGRYVPEEVYRKGPCALTPATIETYEALAGRKLPEAPTEFYLKGMDEAAWNKAAQEAAKTWS